MSGMTCFDDIFKIDSLIDGLGKLFKLGKMCISPHLFLSLYKYYMLNLETHKDKEKSLIIPLLRGSYC